MESWRRGKKWQHLALCLARDWHLVNIWVRLLCWAASRLWSTLHTTLSSSTVYILQEASLMRLRLEGFGTTCMAPFEREAVHLAFLVCGTVRDWTAYSRLGCREPRCCLRLVPWDGSAGETCDCVNAARGAIEITQQILKGKRRGVGRSNHLLWQHFLDKLLSDTATPDILLPRFTCWSEKTRLTRGNEHFCAPVEYL